MFFKHDPNENQYNLLYSTAVCVIEKNLFNYVFSKKWKLLLETLLGKFLRTQYLRSGKILNMKETIWKETIEPGNNRNTYFTMLDFRISFRSLRGPSKILNI